MNGQILALREAIAVGRPERGAANLSRQRRRKDQAALARFDGGVEVVGPQGFERIAIIDVEAFDWNCPQHITPRYALEELAECQRVTDAL